MIIGDKDRFGFEVLSDDLSGELADIFITVAGQRVSGRNPVFVPTFVGKLMGFMKAHESSPATEFEFAAYSDEQAFNLLHEILKTDQRDGSLTPSAVCDYHRLHSIDDSVDDWEIYVFDVADEKHIVCRKISADAGRSENPGPIWSSSLPRKEFLNTLNEFLMLFPSNC